MVVGLTAVSASFIVVLLAAAFLGPTSACVAAVIAEVAATLRVKTRPYAFASNLLAAMLPALVAAGWSRRLAPERAGSEPRVLSRGRRRRHRGRPDA